MPAQIAIAVSAMAPHSSGLQRPAYPALPFGAAIYIPRQAIVSTLATNGDILRSGAKTK